MKISFKYLALILFCILSRLASAQVTINISTGIDDVTGQPIGLGLADDTWSVGLSPTPNSALNNQVPPVPPSIYQSALIGSGFTAPPGPCGSNNIGIPPGVFWASPAVNALGEFTATPTGAYFYKMRFRYPFCITDNAECGSTKVKSIKITINLRTTYPVNVPPPVGINYNNQIIINNIAHLTNNASVIQNFPFTNVYQATFLIPASAINTNGWYNEILYIVGGGGCGTLNQSLGINGLAIDGFVTFNTFDEITDINGAEKNEFCIGEDVVFAGNIACTSYNVNLYQTGGTTPIASALNIAGAPTWVNVTSLFENAPFNYIFQPNQTYEVRVVANTRACGTTTITRSFTYKCCGDINPAAFNLKALSNSLLEGKSNYKGNHQWDVFTAPNPATGPYNPLGSLNLKDITFVVPNNSPCFLVKHTLTSVCGTSCAKQSICYSSCENGNCTLAKPEPLNYDRVTQKLTWGNVAGTNSYVIELLKDGCCSQQTSTSNLSTIPVTGTEYPLDLFGESLGTPAKCYLIKVYAICEDGTRSMPASLCVFP